MRWNRMAHCHDGPMPWNAGDRSRAPASASRTCQGFRWAVGAGGDIVWAEGFGWADRGRFAEVKKTQ